MKSISEGYGYNERLLPGGLRAFFHLARFRWLQRELQRRGITPASVLELGGFDVNDQATQPPGPLESVASKDVRDQFKRPSSQG